MSNQLQRMRNDDLNSMLYWWPKVSSLGSAGIVPMPKTLIYEIPKNQLEKLDEENMEVLDVHLIKLTARKIGYPLFMRTDQSSGKHEWKDTCYVDREKVLFSHIFNLFVSNWCADVLGLPFKALVFREYIPMDSGFTAFPGRLPISRERRYFVKDGEVVCHHPYWPEDALAEADPSTSAWRDILRDMNSESSLEVEILSAYARALGDELRGAWSIDFCRSKAHKWFFIDAALSADSWHPESCSHAREGKK